MVKDAKKAIHTNDFRINLKTGNAVAVDQTVDLDACLAHGTFAVRVGFEAGEVVFIINAADGEAFAFLCAGKNRADTDGKTVIVADRFDGGFCRITGGNRSRQYQNVFADDHGRDVVAENDLASAGVFGRNDVNGAVRVHIHVTCACQFTCHASADHFRAVQTENGINDLGGWDFTAEQMRACASFGETVLGHREVDIIIQVAVAGCKMSSCDTQREIVVLARNFNQLNRHSILLSAAAFEKHAVIFVLCNYYNMRKE